MRRWVTRRSDVLFAHRLFELRREELAAGGESGGEIALREAMVLVAPRWVNVIALDEADHVLLVRQWRFGIAAPTLEIPGGMVEEEDDATAAARELWEETGFRAATWEKLGEVDPNPAFLTNRCTTFLATGLEATGDPVGDGEEELEVLRLPLVEIPGRIARGEIRHALVVAAFYLHEHRDRR